MNLRELKIESLTGLDITRQVLDKCSQLFSENFGYRLDKNRVALSSRRIEKYFYSEDTFLNLAYCGNIFVGYVIATPDSYFSDNPFYWINQLVVKENYRRNGIASALIKSFKCFDYSTIGIITRNEVLIKLLHSISKQVVYNSWHLDKIYSNTKFLSLLDLYETKSIIYSNSGFIIESNIKFNSEPNILNHKSLGLPIGSEKLIFGV